MVQPLGTVAAVINIGAVVVACILTNIAISLNIDPVIIVIIARVADYT